MSKGNDIWMFATPVQLYSTRHRVISSAYNE
jgi:hypothetical protein